MSPPRLHVSCSPPLSSHSPVVLPQPLRLVPSDQIKDQTPGFAQEMNSRGRVPPAQPYSSPHTYTGSLRLGRTRAHLTRYPTRTPSLFQARGSERGHLGRRRDSVREWGDWDHQGRKAATSSTTHATSYIKPQGIPVSQGAASHFTGDGMKAQRD